jgi:hypothetical protein
MVKDFTAEIEDIMQRFDWERVRRTMVALNWTWATSEGIPTIKELQYTARDCLEHAARGYIKSSGHNLGWYSVGTGGFCARISQFNAGAKISLHFEVENKEGIV